MVNRKAFFDIFFYNKENPTRELMEMAESLWRTYMTKYGLGLNAGAVVEPTYEEVREITYMANYAVEMVAKQIAEAEAAEARRKQAARDAWERNVVAAVTKTAVEPEEVEEETAGETPEEAAEEIAEEVTEEEIEEIAEEAVEEVTEEAAEEAGEEPVREIPVEEEAAPKAQAPQKTVRRAGAVCDISLWVEDLICWCQSKGMQCIKTIDDGDWYLHVYFPHKKDVYSVGKWCFQEDIHGAELAAEMTKLYAYCQGFADCFEKLMK